VTDADCAGTADENDVLVQTNGPRFESGVGDALGLGLVPGLDVGTPAGNALFWGRLMFPTTIRPTTVAAITAAATPAIQKGAFCSGTLARDDRTRSGIAALGDPVISSNT
jgi:hypothetical protein